MGGRGSGSPGVKRPARSGSNHPRWKGGIRHDRGYIMILMKSHPRNHRGYVYRHRWVVEKKLGRFLKTNEEVHHVNNIKGDDRPENLCMLPKSIHQVISLARYGCPN